MRFTNIFATEFGGGAERGMPSAYGGLVDPAACEAALPARVNPECRRIRVHANGRAVICRVNDVGPWNTRDAYWLKGARPQAEAQFRDRVPAQNGRVPKNRAGIDLTPAAFDALGIAGRINTRSAIVDWEFVSEGGEI